MEEVDLNKFRNYFDKKTATLYLSIVDVIEALDLSTEPRNYWKTLKSRLNKAENKLVTKCNQVKMRAEDGKMYMTDATDTDTMLVLVQHVAPNKVTQFRKIFQKMYESSSVALEENADNFAELSTGERDEYELSIDLHKEKECLIIQAMLAGSEPEDISIIATTSSILIKGQRINTKKDSYIYTIEELGWGKFSREISLSEEIDIDNIEANYKYGMLTIKMPVLDKSRTKVIKIR